MLKRLFSVFYLVCLLLVSIEGYAQQTPTYVYMVPRGTVWHSTPNCSYLTRSRVINEVEYNSVSVPPCHRCGHLTHGTTSEEQEAKQSLNPQYVYMAPNGKVWHSSPNCSYLSRSKNVSKVKRSSVSVPPCSKCGR